MPKVLKRFASKKFFQIVDLDLLKLLLTPFEADLPFALTELPENEKERRSYLYDRFLKVDETFPPKLADALHCISRLSDRQGLQCLQERAELMGIDLVPLEELAGESDGRHLNPQHVALRAYLQHRKLFENALDFRALIQPSSPKELNGTREGVEARHDDQAARKRFRNAVSQYFSQRYYGRHCETRIYVEDDEVSILVEHGRHMITTPVEEEGRDSVLTFRELRQDTIRYLPATGQIRTSAETAKQRKKLADLFAEHLLGDKDFFNSDDSDNLYTLLPINEQGSVFKFEHAWDDDLQRVRMVELQVKEARDPGRGRGAPWTFTVRDSSNAIALLAKMVPRIQFDTIAIVYLKLEFVFKLFDKPRRIMVKVKPPDTLGFRRDTFEHRILEHLKRNGFVIS